MTGRKGGEKRRFEPLVPGLLPWQVLFLALVCGLLSLRHPAFASVAILLLGAFTEFPKRLWVRAVALTLFFVLGWGAAQIVAPKPPPEMPDWMQQRERVRVVGTVAKVEHCPRAIVRVFLKDAWCERKSGELVPVAGLFLWNWERPTLEPAVGMRANVFTRVRPARGYVNPSGWDTSFYWALRDVYWRGWTSGKRGSPVLEGQGETSLRRTLQQKIVADENGISQGRAMLAALLTGDRFWLSNETFDVMRQASLAHTLALSGMHLGFAAGLGVALACLVGWVRPRVYLRIPRAKLAVLLGAPLVAVYVWLGGATPSLVRAGIMFAVWGVLLLCDRERVLLDGLFVALALIIAASPLSVYDLRLQMSAVAVAGIGLFGPALWQGLEKLAGRMAARKSLRKKHDARHYARRGVGERMILAAAGITVMSMCTNAALLPLIVGNFGCVAVGLYCNLFWLPFLGLLVMPVGLCGLALLCLPLTAGIGQYLLDGAAFLLQYGIDILSALDAMGRLPEVASLRPVWMENLGYGMAVVAVVFMLGRRGRKGMLAALCAVVLLCGPALVRGVQAQKHGVALTMLDTGQSQALCIDVPGGGRVMVDAGGGMPGFDIGRAVVGPVLASNHTPRIDLAVLTHPDTDHYRGYPYLLRYFDVRRFAWNGVWPENVEAASLRSAVAAAGLQAEAWHRGQRVAIAPDLWLEVLHPQAGAEFRHKNDLSLVLRLVWKGRGLALLPGDVETEGIVNMLRHGGDITADVLVVPHHGSKSSFCGALYDAVGPKVALASAGFVNYRRYPNWCVKEAMAERSVPLFTPGTDGAVRVLWRTPDAEPVVETTWNEKREWRKASLTLRAENPAP